MQSDTERHNFTTTIRAPVRASLLRAATLRGLPKRYLTYLRVRGYSHSFDVLASNLIDVSDLLIQRMWKV